MTKFIISSDPFLTKAVKIDNNRLSVAIIRKKSDLVIVGNIYKGVVNNISQSLNAAFVDIGIDKNAFLSMGEYNNNELSVHASQMMESDSNLQVGDTVLVQVFKPIIASKGPKVTRNITLPGNYLVLLRNNNFVGISKQIEDSYKSEELRNFLRQFSTENVGFIARTASQFASFDDLKKEILYLKKINESVTEKAYLSEAPSSVYEEPFLPIRLIREYCDVTTDEVIFDSKSTYSNTKNHLLKMNNSYLGKLKLYKYNEPIFRHFGIEDDVKSLESNTVRLRNGGYVIIEKTEALFAIDVNSGQYNYDDDVENAIFEINKEAAYEIFNQITLRDMGGLIVIDFIDMTNESHKKELEDVLYGLAEKNRRKTRLSKISKFGLIEISRRKSGNDIFDEMFDKCEGCLNSGLVKSISLVCSEIYETIRYSDSKKFSLSATASVTEYMKEKIGNMGNRIDYKTISGCNAKDYTLEVIQ